MFVFVFTWLLAVCRARLLLLHVAGVEDGVLQRVEQGEDDGEAEQVVQGVGHGREEGREGGAGRDGAECEQH